MLLSFVTVRGWRSRNVPDGKSKTLLHGNEEARKKETAESDKKTDQSILSYVLRFIQFTSIRNCNIRFNFSQHVNNGH